MTYMVDLSRNVYSELCMHTYLNRYIGTQNLVLTKGLHLDLNPQSCLPVNIAASLLLMEVP